MPDVLHVQSVQPHNLFMFGLRPSTLPLNPNPFICPYTRNTPSSFFALPQLVVKIRAYVHKEQENHLPLHCHEGNFGLINIVVVVKAGGD